MAGSFVNRIGDSPEEGIKAPVVATAKVAVVLSGVQTIDGYLTAAGDRVLVMSQADPAQNGIYRVSDSAWTRVTDFNAANDVVNGVLVLSADTGELWQAVFTGIWRPDVTDLTFRLVLTFTAIGAGEFIPLAGTSSGGGGPITGPLEFRSSAIGSWTLHQGNLFGLNAFIFAGGAINSDFIIQTKDALGDTKQFDFTKDGQLYLPSKTVGNNEVWVMQGADFLHLENVLSFYSFDQSTGLRTTNPIHFYTSEIEAFIMNTNGTITQSGLVTTANDNQTLTTRKYVDDAISGVGNLPPDAAGNLLVGTGSGWQVAEGITLDNVTNPGQADLKIAGALTILNTDPAHLYNDWHFLTGDFFGTNGLGLLPSAAQGSFAIWTDAAATVGFVFTNGFLSLPAEPTHDSHATTKKYVDDRLQSGNAEDDLMRWDGTNWVPTSSVQISDGGNVLINQTLQVLDILALGNAGPVGSILRIDDYGIVNAAPGMSVDDLGNVSMTGTLHIHNEFALGAAGTVGSVLRLGDYGIVTSAGYDYDEVVLTHSNQSIAGDKTFSGAMRVSNSLSSTVLLADNLVPGSGKILVVGALGEIGESGSRPSDFSQTSHNHDSWYPRKSSNETINSSWVFAANQTFTGRIAVDGAVMPPAGISAAFNTTIQVHNWISDGGVNVMGNIAGALVIQSSDISLKEDVVSTRHGLDEILALHPVDFQWKRTGKVDTGFIAQEVKPHIPEATPQNPDGLLGFKEGPILATLVKAVQEQQAMIEDLQLRLETLGG